MINFQKYSKITKKIKQKNNKKDKMIGYCTGCEKIYKNSQAECKCGSIVIPIKKTEYEEIMEEIKNNKGITKDWKNKIKEMN